MSESLKLIILSVVIVLWTFSFIKLFKDQKIKDNDSLNKTHKMAMTAILMALTVALQLFSNYITFGPIAINLALIPLIIGAIILGPMEGLLLGVIDGAIILTAPSTMGFISINPAMTVLLCFTKTGLAGLVCGYVSRLFKKHQKIGVIISSILVPIINTGIFMVGAYFFFLDVFGGNAMILITGVLSINFVIEFITVSVLSISVYYISDIAKKRFLKVQNGI